MSRNKKRKIKKPVGQKSQHRLGISQRGISVPDKYLARVEKSPGHVAVEFKQKLTQAVDRLAKAQGSQARMKQERRHRELLASSPANSHESLREVRPGVWGCKVCGAVDKEMAEMWCADWLALREKVVEAMSEGRSSTDVWMDESGKWFHATEDESQVGPFDTQEDAEEACKQYAAWLNPEDHTARNQNDSNAASSPETQPDTQP